MNKILIVTPHLSTGGLPQYLERRIQTLVKKYDVCLVECKNISNKYTVQKDRILNMVNNFVSLSDTDSSLYDVIMQFEPMVVHFEEIPELCDLDMEILKRIYCCDRKYFITETTHTSTFLQNHRKVFLPDKFLFVSPHSVNEYAQYLHKIPYDVILYPIEKRNKIQENSLNIDEDSFHILNVGLFTSGKNQSHIIDVAKYLENFNIRFHFVGNQASNFSDYWKPLMINLPSNCTIWGEQADIQPFYSMADIMFFSSLYELNPLVIRESLGYEHLNVVMKNLDTYCGMYDEYQQIYFSDMNDSRKDANLILNLLGFDARV